MACDAHDGPIGRLAFGELGDCVVTKIVESQTMQGTLYVVDVGPTSSARLTSPLYLATNWTVNRPCK
jgi:hypothetical protein